MADKTDVLLQIKVDEKSIKDVKSTIKNVKKDIEKESISVVSTKQTSEITKQTQEYDKLISKVKIFKDQQERTLKTLQAGKYSGFADSKEIAKFKSELDSLSATTPNLSTRMKEVDNQLKNIKTNAVLAGTGVQSFTKDLVHNTIKMAEWGISGTVLFGTLNKIGESIKFITEMDTAFANIRMASGLTRDDTAGLASEYNNLAKELGVSTKVIANSAVELYRQGLSTQEAKAQLQDYIKFAKVLGRDLQSTIELGTAGTTTYSVSVEKLGSIATSVGDAVASSGDEVLQIIQKSGSSAQVAGVQLEELATIGALMASTTRESGSQIGNSLKNIFSKLSQVDDLTGEINDDYGKTLKRISSLGIEIEDGNGNLLDAMQILKNVGGQWDELSVQQQKYLASGFGIYQLNRFSAAVKAVSGNSQEYNDLLKVAYESTGQLDKKYEEYSNSVEASNERLKASWEDLYINVLDSGMIQATIGLGTAFVDILNKTNAVQVAMVALGVVLSVNMYRAFVSLSAIVAETIIVFQRFGLAATVTLINPVGLAAVGIGVLVGALIAVSKHMEEAEKASINMANSVASNNTQVASLVSSITDLNGTQELNEQQQLRLQQTYDELLKIYPELENLVDRNTLSYDSLTEATLKASNAQKQLAQEAINAQKASLTALLASEKDMQEKRKSSATTSKPIPGFAGFSQADLIPVADANIAKIEKQLKDLNKAEAELNKTAITKSTFTPTIKKDGDGVKYTPTDKSKSKSLTAEKDEVALTKERYAQLNQELNKINATIELNKALQENTVDMKNKNKLLEAEIELIKLKQIAISNLASEQRKERDEIANSLKGRGVKFTGTGDTLSSVNAQDVINKKIDEINKHRADKDKTLYNQLKANLQSLQSDYDRFIQLQITDIPKAGVEWTKLKGEIGNVSQEISNNLKKSLEDTDKLLEDQIKDTQDLYKQLADALEKQDEAKLESFKQTSQDRIDVIDEELKTLERLYNKATDKIAEDDLNKKISDLTKQRQMEEIEGSVESAKRIYEIDKELVELKKQQSEMDREQSYKTEKEKLEDAKDKISKEVKAEEEALRKRKLTQQYYADAKVLIEQNALTTIVELLKTYDEQFALDGQTKGQKWLDQFALKLAQAQALIANVTGNIVTVENKPLTNNGLGSIGGVEVQGPPKPTKSNQQKYLENLASSGTSGQKKWAESQLKQGNYPKYATGGVNDFTGLAQLDGTKSMPELVLNSSQISNVASQLGISGNPSAMANKLYNFAKGGSQVGGQAPVVNINMSVNAEIASNMDIKNVSKTLAYDMNQEMSKRGIRI